MPGVRHIALDTCGASPPCLWRTLAMVFFRRHQTQILLILALIAMGAGFCAVAVPAEFRAAQQQLIGFPDADVQAQQARPMVLAALGFLPALAALVYAFGGTIDRYITRQFLGIFGICLCGLFMIWMLIDLTNNFSDLRGSPHVLRTVGKYYLTSTPAILLQLLPYSLLLSLLHALGKLSTNREIIAVIQSGRGILRITLPLMIFSLFCTLMSLGLNYQWAPGFDKRQDEILAEARGKQTAAASHVLYRNPENRRLWMIGSFPTAYQKGEPLLNVEVTTTGDNHILQSRLSASHARWDRTKHQWTFDHPVISRYVPGQAPVFEKLSGPLILDDWSETPWQLIKPGLSAVHLGVPDLSGWLQAHARHPSFADPSPYLTQWHYRWALPFTCLVTVLLATPLALHFSRRAPGGDIFLAVVLSALLLLISNIVIAFGEAGTLQPAFAAWLPNIAFSLLGIYLFRGRISGRPFHHPLRKLLTRRT